GGVVRRAPAGAAFFCREIEGRQFGVRGRGKQTQNEDKNQIKSSHWTPIVSSTLRETLSVHIRPHAARFGQERNDQQPENINRSDQRSGHRALAIGEEIHQIPGQKWTWG